MENQVNENVKELQEALSGMVMTVGVAVNPSRKDLLKMGGVAMVGTVIGTVGYHTIANWMQKRKYKKTIEEINKGIDKL
jgi:preprotein translocase subunit Sss1